MGDQSLYAADILAWTEQQAAALRALAARPDLPNVIEEIEASGRTELKAATSPIRLILEHLVKLASDPVAQARTRWIEEILRWHRDVQDSMAPSMRGRVDLETLWRRARRDAERALALHGAQAMDGLPDRCPLALEDFLAADFDYEGALAMLRAGSGH